MWEALRHAFAIDRGEEALTAEEEAVLDKVAGKIVQRGMVVPTLIFLELGKPLSFIGAQALIFLEPFIKAFFNPKEYQLFYRMMEKRKNLERLIQRVEDKDRERVGDRAQ